MKKIKLIINCQKCMKIFILLLLSINSIHAQLKVGRNPTVLSNNTLFQIESYSGSMALFTKDSSFLGLGTVNPIYRLDIQNGSKAGAIRIVDGTQGAGKVLTSDANGVGTWTKNISSVDSNDIARMVTKSPIKDSIAKITGSNGLILKRVSCISSKTQTILDPNIPISSPIILTYEDSVGEVISAVVKKRVPGVSFTVEYAAIPSNIAFLNYAIPAFSTVVATGPQGPAGTSGANYFKGIVNCTATATQFVSDVNVTSNSVILFNYEDNNGDQIYLTLKSKATGTGFTIQYGAIPPTTSKVHYTIFN